MKEIVRKFGKDVHGHSTLDKLSKANHFNHWIYESIKPWLNGAILEIGSGIGNISSLIVDDGFQILVSDTDERYLEILQEKFNGINSVNQILPLNLIDINFDQKFHYLFQSFDTVIAINVMEHIENDLIAFKNAQKFLKSDGMIIVLVPNAPFLYNKLDQNLNHFRRYNRRMLKDIFNKIKLEEVKLFYFNLIGVAGWLFSSGMLRSKTIPTCMIKIFEFMIPWTSWLDKLFKSHFGLSIIVIGKKQR